MTAVRVNKTTFNVSVKVLYTGAGDRATLMLTNITFRDEESDSWFQFNQVIKLIQISDSGMDWYAVLVDSRFATLNGIVFSFNIQNNVTSEVGDLITVVAGMITVHVVFMTPYHIMAYVDLQSQMSSNLAISKISSK